MKTKAGRLLIAVCMLQLVTHVVSTSALASPTGDNCRKEICNSAVSGCMRSNQTLNPIASTEAEKKTYCAAFFNGCMTSRDNPRFALVLARDGCQVLAMSSIDLSSPQFVRMRGY